VADEFFEAAAARCSENRSSSTEYPPHETPHPMNVTTELIFDNARTHNVFTPEPIPEALLRRLYDLVKWGPTSANCSPARFIFVTTPDAKSKLLPGMAPGNVEKTKQAPVTVIVGMDMAFYEKLPQLFPHADAKSWFVGNQPMIDATAFRNSSIQGGYLILAARALGLDCGPMSGFDAAKVDAAFWAGTTVKTNFIVNLGHGDASKLFGRSPRLTFEDACQIA
jgi:3-hydroxypropanoate dehydrogenase